MAENDPVVQVAVEDTIATVTLNRPGARNALNRATQYALWDAVAAADADPDVRVLILTGADPAFCAGVDLKEVSGERPSSVPPRSPAEPGPGREATGPVPVPAGNGQAGDRGDQWPGGDRRP